MKDLKLFCSKQNKKGSVDFVLDYTRDFSIIMEEAWSNGIKYVYNNILETDMPSDVPCIYFIKDGVIEVWDNADTFTKIKELLHDYNNKYPEFIHEILESFRNHLRKTQEIRKNGSALKDAVALNTFIDMLFTGVIEWIIFDYTAKFKDTDDGVRKACHDTRNIDTFWDDADYILRTTLKKLYPVMELYENVILRKEVNNPPALSVLKQRAKKFVVIPGVFHGIMELEDVSKRSPEFIFQYPEGKISGNTLHGVVACKGGVHRGRVRVIRKKRDAKLLQDGEILVSPMTTPDFVNAMKHSAAVVTDEGGITCHAAIVSREMKKPCIIGTKIATKVLRDGDLVEVDAKHGVVKILKRSLKSK